MLLFLWLHSWVGKSTLPPSLGHETCKGKDKVQSQPIRLFRARCTHTCTLAFFLLPPQCLHFPVPTAQQFSCNATLCSFQPGPGPGMRLQHLLPLPVAADLQHEGSQEAQLKPRSSEGARPGHPETPLRERPPSTCG